MTQRRIAIFVPNFNSNGTVRIGLSQAEVLLAAGEAPVLFVLRGDGDFQPPAGVPVHYLYERSEPLGNLPAMQQGLRQLVHRVEAEHGPFDLFFSNTTRCDRVLAGCGFAPTFYFCHCALGKELWNEARRGPFKLWKRWQQARALIGQHIITVSHGIEAELRALRWLKPASVRTIYNPFLLDEIHRRQQEVPAGLPDEPFMIHVGRFARQKRHDILFQALLRMPDAPKLVLLGTKPEKVRKLAKRYGVADRVIAAGFQSNPYAWIARAELMLLSSDYEGLPTVLIESIACGTPVVSTDCPHGPAEILTGNLRPYLVPCRDPQALADAAIRCLASPPDLTDPDILRAVSARQIASQYLALCQPKA